MADEIISMLDASMRIDVLNLLADLRSRGLSILFICMVTFNLSRSVSYFESGIGRGLGFRDSNQDLLGFVHLVPERARQRLLDLAATQLETGGAYHQYQPLTKRSNNDGGGNFNDDPLWLVLAVSAYVEETGDWSVLDELVPYDNRPGSETPLYEHLQRCVRYTLERLGPHGLPLIGRADWNDCLNLNCFSDAPGESFQTITNKDSRTAESVFIAGMFVVAAREMAALAKCKSGDGEAERYRAAARQVEAAVREHGWDGEWYVRYFDADGAPLGSRKNAHGQIYINSQSWAVLSGFAPPERARTALDSMNRRLNTGKGVKISTPGFNGFDPARGASPHVRPAPKKTAAFFCTLTRGRSSPRPFWGLTTVLTSIIIRSTRRRRTTRLTSSSASHTSILKTSWATSTHNSVWRATVG